MAGIVFYFEDRDIDVFSGSQDCLGAWNNAIKLCRGIDRVVIVNQSGVVLKSFDSSLEIEVVSKMPENLSGTIAQLMCPWRINGEAVSLWGLEHAVIDWYLFGPASGWGLHPDNMPVIIPQDGIGACHSVHIATVVMAHRHHVLEAQR